MNEVDAIKKKLAKDFPGTLYVLAPEVVDRIDQLHLTPQDAEALRQLVAPLGTTEAWKILDEFDHFGE